MSSFCFTGLFEGLEVFFIRDNLDIQKEKLKKMSTLTILKIIFTAFLCVPVLGLTFFFVGKLMDEVIKKPGRQK